MAKQRWSTDEQLEFLRKYLPAFAAAKQTRKKNEMKRFWAVLEQAWFAAFSLKEELVSRGLLPKDVLEEGYAIPKGSNEEKVYQAEMAARQLQIKTLIRYELLAATEKAGAGESSSSAMTAAAKAFAGKTQRRVSQPQEMYYRLFKKEVDEMFEKEKGTYVDDPKEKSPAEDVDIMGVVAEDGEDAKDGKPAKKRRGWNLNLRRKIFTREWGKATDEQKATVLAEIEKEREHIALEADLEGTGKGLARPAELRQSSLDRLNTFWGSNARQCWDNAAMMSVQIGIAPDPSDGEKLMTMSISYGLDPNGRVFQDVFPDFHAVFVRPILDWAKKNVFTPAAWENAKQEDKAAREKAAAGAAQGEEADVDVSKDGESDAPKVDDSMKPSSMDDDDGEVGEDDDKDNDPVLGDLGMDINGTGEEDDGGFDEIHGISKPNDSSAVVEGAGSNGETVVEGAPPKGMASSTQAAVPFGSPPTVPKNPPQNPSPIPEPSHPPSHPSLSAFSSSNLPPNFNSIGTHQAHTYSYPSSFAAIPHTPQLSTPIATASHKPHDHNSGPNESVELGLQRAFNTGAIQPPSSIHGMAFDLTRLHPAGPFSHPGTFPGAYQMIDPTLHPHPQLSLAQTQPPIGGVVPTPSPHTLLAGSPPSSQIRTGPVATVAGATSPDPVFPHGTGITSPIAAATPAAATTPITRPVVSTTPTPTTHSQPSTTTPTTHPGAAPTPGPTQAMTATPQNGPWKPSFGTNIPVEKPKAKGDKPPAATAKNPPATRASKDSNKADEIKKRKAANPGGVEKPAKVAKTGVEPSIEETEQEDEGRSRRTRKPAKRFEDGQLVDVVPGTKPTRSGPKPKVAATRGKGKLKK